MARHGRGRLIRPAWLLPALLWLAGCAGGPGPGICAPELAATLALQPGSHLIVEVTLNRQPARFLLDTGAEASQVTPFAMTHYNLAHAQGQTTVRGLGGQVLVSDAIGSIEIAGAETRQRFSVIDVPFPPAAGMPYAGIIGADLLSGFDMEVSVPEHVVRLWRVPGCAGDYVPWSRRHWAIPLRRTVGGRLLLSVRLDDVPLSALLDSGINVSVLSEREAQTLRVPAEALAADRAGQGTGVGSGAGSGVDGERLWSRRHRFGSMVVGPERFTEPHLVVSPIDLSDGDMLLGLDWMRLRPVWISWSSRQVFVQPLRAPPPPPEEDMPRGVPDAAAGPMVQP